MIWIEITDNFLTQIMVSLNRIFKMVLILKPSRKKLLFLSKNSCVIVYYQYAEIACGFSN